MKHTVLILLSITALLYSCSTQKDKTKEMISDYIINNFNELLDYQPVEYGRIDSSFTSVDYTQEVKDLENKAFLYYLNQKEALNAIEAENLTNKEIKSKEKTIQDSEEEIKRIAEKIDSFEKDFTPEFVGFQMIHRFKGKTEDGKYLITDLLFIFDPELTSIIKIKEIEPDE